mgnify:CR=1 FL=1
MHVIARMNVGGPAVEIAELMRGLDPQEIQQLLVTGYCDEDEVDFLETQAPDIEAVRIPGLGRAIRSTGDLRAFVRLVRAIREFEPDVVHTHTAKAGVLGRLAARVSGRKVSVVHTYHGHLLHGYFKPWKTRLLVHVERGLARITSQIVTVGMQVRRDLLNAGIGRDEQYVVIRSGVRIKQPPDSFVARQQLGLPQRVTTVALIGRLTKVKRPDRFIEVAANLVADNTEVFFVVAGGGEDEAEIMDAAVALQLPMTFLGWRSDIETVLAASDVIVLTSDNEGTPLSLIQAALVGIPAVATDVGSVSEVVVDGVTGLLCPPSSESIAEKLSMLIQDSQLRSKMGVEARKFAKENYEPRQFLESHRTVYERSSQARRG